jgi:hypothetical protein
VVVLELPGQPGIERRVFAGVVYQLRRRIELYPWFELKGAGVRGVQKGSG